MDATFDQGTNASVPARRSVTPSSDTVRVLRRRSHGVAAALAILTLMVWGFRGLRSEDFVYYYCAGATANCAMSVMKALRCSSPRHLPPRASAARASARRMPSE